MARHSSSGTGIGTRPKLRDEKGRLVRSPGSQAAKRDRAIKAKYRRGLKRFEKEGRKKPEVKLKTEIVHHPKPREKLKISIRQDPYLKTLYFVSIRGANKGAFTSFSSNKKPDKNHPAVVKLLKHCRY